MLTNEKPTEYQCLDQLSPVQGTLEVKTKSCAAANQEYVNDMDWQQMVSLAIVGVTVGIVAWRALRPRKFSFEHDTHCGCVSQTGAASQGSMVIRSRKGERQRVIVRM